MRTQAVPGSTLPPKTALSNAVVALPSPSLAVTRTR